MFRIPSLSELFGLFVKSRTVAGATKLLSDTAHRLEEVVTHHEHHADAKSALAHVLRTEAVDLDHEVASHNAEAIKAASVAANLNALLS